MFERPLIAVIPSYNRPAQLAATIEGLKSVVTPDAIETLVQEEDKPLGGAEARRQLLERAVRKYGPKICILSLDDDCIFPAGHCDVRWACEHFEDDIRVGVISLRSDPKDKGVSADRCFYAQFMFHVFLVRGEVVAEGINYRPKEFVDEIDFSFRAWLAGWRLLRSHRARVPHHVTNWGKIAEFGGGIEGSFLRGIPVWSDFVSRYRGSGLLTMRTQFRDGVELPYYSRIYVTPKARAIHKENAARRGWGRKKIPAKQKR